MIVFYEKNAIPRHCPGSQKLAVLQEQYESCAGQWERSTFFISLKSENRSSRRGCRKWLTRAQIAQKYQSMEVANLICDSKLKDETTKAEQTKQHWDCPECEAWSFWWLINCFNSVLYQPLKQFLVFAYRISVCSWSGTARRRKRLRTPSCRSFLKQPRETES